MSSTPGQPEIYFAERADQVRALISPVRQVILELICTEGPVPISAIARMMGRSPATLYRHVRALEEAGLVHLHETRKSGRHTERWYRSVAPVVRLRLKPGDKANASAIADALASQLRMVERSVREGLLSADVDVEGPQRKVRALAVYGWVSAAGLVRIHAVFDQLIEELRTAAADEPADDRDYLGVTMQMFPTPFQRHEGHEHEAE